MYNQYLVLGDSLPGREAEYDDWYVWVHVRDVMGPRESAIAAQAFRRADIEIASGPDRFSHGFLCAFENTDPVAMTGSSGGAIPPGMLMSSALDRSAGMGGGYFDTVVHRTRTPGEWPDADLIVEWIGRPHATADEIEAYVDTRFAALMRDPDIVSGWLGKASGHQLFDIPRPAYVAFYRTTSLERVAARWSENGGEVPFPFGWSEADVSATCFRQISERVTRSVVVDPDPATAAKAAAVRKAVKPLPM